MIIILLMALGISYSMGEISSYKKCDSIAKGPRKVNIINTEDGLTVQVEFIAKDIGPDSFGEIEYIPSNSSSFLIGLFFPSANISTMSTGYGNYLMVFLVRQIEKLDLLDGTGNLQLALYNKPNPDSKCKFNVWCFAIPLKELNGAKSRPRVARNLQSFQKRFRRNIFKRIGRRLRKKLRRIIPKN